MLRAVDRILHSTKKGQTRQDYPIAAALSTTGVLDGDVDARRSGTNWRTRPHGPTYGRFHHRWSRIGGRGDRQSPHSEQPFSRSAAGGWRQDTSAVAGT